MSTCKHYCVTCGKHADVDGLICGDCGEESAAAHAQQLAAERAKVALVVGALKPLTAEVAGMIGIEEQAFRDLLGNTNVNCLKQRWLDARSTLETLQSPDALADIRRDVARECAEILDAMVFAAPESKWESSCNDAFKRAAKAIRNKFGVTE